MSGLCIVRVVADRIEYSTLPLPQVSAKTLAEDLNEAVRKVGDSFQTIKLDGERFAGTEVLTLRGRAVTSIEVLRVEDPGL